MTEELSKAIQEFGQPSATFRPSAATRFAGIVLGILLAPAGLALLWVGTKLILYDGLSSGRVTCATGGLVLIAFGVFLIYYTVAVLFFVRVLVCPKGLIRVLRRKIDTCPWDQIKELIEEHSKDGVAMNKRYIVHRHAGEDLVFISDEVSRVGRLAKLIRAETEKRNIPWNTVTR